MSGAPGRALAAALVLDLRTPLARVELAASQLARDAASPACQLLVDGICETVREIDARIERILNVLVAPAARAEPRPVDELLAELRERLGPALEARGVCWQTSLPANVVLHGDPDRVRRCAAALLRAGAAAVGVGGRLCLHPVRENGCEGLRLEGRPAAGQALRTPPEGLLAALRELAGTAGAPIDAAPAGEGFRATLWWSDACPSC